MSNPLIEVERLSKVYDTGEVAVNALQDVSLTIFSGDFVAIMGPSGSGKSTFLNVIGCLDTPTDGTYRLNGLEVSGLSDDELAEIRSTMIGYVFQSFNLLPRTTALFNVELPLFYNPVLTPLRHDRATSRLEQVGLGERLNHIPSALSGGQQQRVAIARALVNDPLLILADEPTGMLDTKTGGEIMSILQRLNDEGTTIVMVTHEPDIARHAKRIVRFRDGRVVSDEPVQDRLASSA